MHEKKKVMELRYEMFYDISKKNQLFNIFS